MKTNLKSSVRTKTAQRYVTALFNIVKEKNVFEDVAQDLETILSLLSNSGPFRQFIENIGMDVPSREKLIKKIFEGKIHALTLKFLLFLNTKNRLNILREVCVVFAQQYLEHQGILAADIRAPYALTKQQVETICSKLQQRFQKSIQPNFSIDQTVLGGFRIQVKDLVLDYSMRGQLERLKKRVLKEGLKSPKFS